MLKRVKFDANKCTGCGICELACSAVKERVYNPEKARIKVVKQGLPFQVAVLVCAQCRKAACAAACPSHASRGTKIQEHWLWMKRYVSVADFVLTPAH